MIRLIGNWITKDVANGLQRLDKYWREGIDFVIWQTDMWLFGKEIQLANLYNPLMNNAFNNCDKMSYIACEKMYKDELKWAQEFHDGIISAAIDNNYHYVASIVFGKSVDNPPPNLI